MNVKLTKEQAIDLFIYAYVYSRCSLISIQQGGKEINISFFKCLERVLGLPFAIMWWKTPKGYGLSFQEVVGDINERYVIDFEFPSDEIAYILIKDYNLPVLQYFFTKDEVIDYLQVYQDWRRGADTEQPDPTTLGYVIDEAIKILKEK
jgi:hypothetical protein